MGISQILRQADIFFELTASQIELISAVAEERRYMMDEVIFEEQTSGQELYVIAEGEVHILINPALIGQASKDGKPYTVAVMRRGQSFGEVSLVDEGKRSASARSGRHDTHLVIIPRNKLMLLCETYPQLGFRLMRNLAADLAMKIRNTDIRIRDQLYWSHDESKPATE
jgi:CRP/FNR family transcriptional regulator, cyclic AMP receptor protein